MLKAALAGTSTSRLGRRESVALMAGLMALNAIGIDAMVPALPDIGRSLGVSTENQRQLVIICYMLGFGVGQLFWGPLADRFGRRHVLVIGVSLYTVFALGCAASTSFPMMIAARVLMGAAAASTRVLVVAIVRDLFEGERMARLMSLVFMVFMVVPVLAPSLGQAILAIAQWRAIFVVLAGLALGMLGWSLLRLPETLHPENRRSLDAGEIVAGGRAVASDRLAVGYTLASSALFGTMSAYVASVQQIVGDIFHSAERLPLVFGVIAAPMALAAWTNSRIVGRFGLRQVGHFGLMIFLAVFVTHLLFAISGHETLASFVVLQSLAMTSFAFCSSNFSTLAMTNMSELAGTASSVQGVVSTICGAAIGLVIGQSFDGTVIPFLTGASICAAAALGAVMLTERGRLLEPRAA